MNNTPMLVLDLSLEQSDHTHFDDPPIWQPELLRPAPSTRKPTVTLAHRRRASRGEEFLVLLARVKSDVACLLLDRPNCFHLGGGGKVGARLAEEELELVGDVSDRWRCN